MGVGISLLSHSGLEFKAVQGNGISPTALGMLGTLGMVFRQN